MKGRVMFVLSQASGVCGGIDSAAIRGKRRFAQGVYYNTTGICTAGIAQQRPKMLGYARFHQCGGFDPHHPSRMVGRVFDCAEPSVWGATNKFLLRRALGRPELPDSFLVVVQS
jgi:hypothetical protein